MVFQVLNFQTQLNLVPLHRGGVGGGQVVGRAQAAREQRRLRTRRRRTLRGRL